MCSGAVENRNGPVLVEVLEIPVIQGGWKKAEKLISVKIYRWSLECDDQSDNYFRNQLYKIFEEDLRNFTAILQVLGFVSWIAPIVGQSSEIWQLRAEKQRGTRKTVLVSLRSVER